MLVNYNSSILNYVSSIRQYYGLDCTYKVNEEFTNLLNERKPDKIILLLIDGMGAYQINRDLKKDSFLRRYLYNTTSTVFPPTTTAATTSIRNGKSPNQNGWLSWIQYFKELDDYIVPFLNRGFYSDVQYDNNFMNKTIPVNETVKELNNKKIHSRNLFPLFDENGCADFEEMINRLIDYVHNSDYKYIYSYWDEYDSICHTEAPSSNDAINYLKYINDEIERLANNLTDDTLLFVTADHGHIDVGYNYDISKLEINKYLRLKPTLEFRSSVFYVKEGYEKQFEEQFKKDFTGKYLLLNRQEVIDKKIFGDYENHKRFNDFIGDYLYISLDDSTVSYEPRTHFKGQHAGGTKKELEIPVIIY